LQLCVQDLDAVHRIGLLGHKVLFILHMVLHTLLHKAAPTMFGGPGLQPLVMGTAPYRGFTETMYKDGIMLAGIVIAATASILHNL